MKLSVAWGEEQVASAKRLRFEYFEVKQPSPRWIGEMDRCLNELKVRFRPAWQCITENTHQVVWLQPTGERQMREWFACASFHEELGTTFITDLAFRHIPANVLFAEVSDYAIQENLYHESLHQKLCRILDTTPLFVAPRSVLSKLQVFIPWREKTWDLIKALHAYYVYQHLLIMRRAMFDSSQAESIGKAHLQRAIREGTEAVAILYRGLLAHQNVLTPAGLSVLDRL